MIFGSLRGETTRTMSRFHVYASNLLSTLPKTNQKHVLHAVWCKRIYIIDCEQYSTKMGFILFKRVDLT